MSNVRQADSAVNMVILFTEKYKIYYIHVCIQSLIMCVPNEGTISIHHQNMIL